MHMHYQKNYQIAYKLYCFGFCGCFLVFDLICHLIKSSSQQAPVSELYYHCVESSAHIEELCNMLGKGGRLANAIYMQINRNMSTAKS